MLKNGCEDMSHKYYMGIKGSNKLGLGLGDSVGANKHIKSSNT